MDEKNTFLGHKCSQLIYFLINIFGDPWGNFKRLTTGDFFIEMMMMEHTYTHNMVFVNLI